MQITEEAFFWKQIVSLVISELPYLYWREWTFLFLFFSSTYLKGLFTAYWKNHFSVAMYSRLLNQNVSTVDERQANCDLLYVSRLQPRNAARYSIWQRSTMKQKWIHICKAASGWLKHQERMRRSQNLDHVNTVQRKDRTFVACEVPCSGDLQRGFGCWMKWLMAIYFKPVSYSSVLHHINTELLCSQLYMVWIIW